MGCQESLSTSALESEFEITRSLCLSDGQSESLCVNTDDGSQECDRFLFKANLSQRVHSMD